MHTHNVLHAFRWDIYVPSDIALATIDFDAASASSTILPCLICLSLLLLGAGCSCMILKTSITETAEAFHPMLAYLLRLLNVGIETLIAKAAKAFREVRARVLLQNSIRSITMNPVAIVTELTVAIEVILTQLIFLLPFFAFVLFTILPFVAILIS